MVDIGIFDVDISIYFDVASTSLREMWELEALNVSDQHTTCSMMQSPRSFLSFVSNIKPILSD